MFYEPEKDYDNKHGGGNDDDTRDYVNDDVNKWHLFVGLHSVMYLIGMILLHPHKREVDAIIIRILQRIGTIWRVL